MRFVLVWTGDGSCSGHSLIDKDPRAHGMFWMSEDPEPSRRTPNEVLRRRLRPSEPDRSAYNSIFLPDGIYRQIDQEQQRFRVGGASVQARVTYYINKYHTD